MNRWSLRSAKLFVTIGTLEGISYLLLLLVAMPLKYWCDMPEYVRVVGMIHGILFLAYVGHGLYLTLYHSWLWKWFLWIVIASLLPFGPFVADRKIIRERQKAKEENLQANRNP